MFSKLSDNSEATGRIHTPRVSNTSFECERLACRTSNSTVSPGVSNELFARCRRKWRRARSTKNPRGSNEPFDSKIAERTARSKNKPAIVEGAVRQPRRDLRTSRSPNQAPSSNGSFAKPGAIFERAVRQTRRDRRTKRSRTYSFNPNMKIYIINQYIFINFAHQLLLYSFLFYLLFH